MARTINLLIVWGLTGFWHGANWTFVVWGMLHGIYRIVGTLTLRYRNAFIETIGFKTDARPVLMIRRVITFILVAFAWVFFRANSIGDAFMLIGAIFTRHASVNTVLSFMQLDTVSIFLVIFAVAIMILLDRSVSYDENDCSDIVTQNGAFVYYVFAIMFVWLLLLSRGESSTFIYFQF